mmetsp:Transcript_72987/g.171086  ORF Transcript_72987/g.171086 Transcript_72987/m.171086 type:complete len:218 (+) Transcript_72987:30-683(+)
MSAAPPGVRVADVAARRGRRSPGHSPSAPSARSARTSTWLPSSRRSARLQADDQAARRTRQWRRRLPRMAPVWRMLSKPCARQCVHLLNSSGGLVLVALCCERRRRSIGAGVRPVASRAPRPTVATSHSQRCSVTRSSFGRSTIPRHTEKSDCRPGARRSWHLHRPQSGPHGAMVRRLRNHQHEAGVWRQRFRGRKCLRSTLPMRPRQVLRCTWRCS